jgi:hypothetical protein
LSSRWLYVWSRGGGALSLMISRLVSSSKPDMRPKHPHNAAWGSGGGGGGVQCTRRNTRGQYLSTEVKHGGECVNVLAAALHSPAATLIQGLGTHTAQPVCMGGWAGVGPGGGGAREEKTVMVCVGNQSACSIKLYRQYINCGRRSQTVALASEPQAREGARRA